MPNPFCIQPVSPFSLSLFTIPKSPKLILSHASINSSNLSTTHQNHTTLNLSNKQKNMFSFPYFITTLQFLLLILSTISFSFSTSTISNATSIYEVLRNYGLPMGIFPKGVTQFNVEEDGTFWVHLDQACNAKFENDLHYDRNVSGSLSFGKIDALTGLEAQDLFLWFPVMSIRVDVPSSGLIYFDVGAAFKQFSLSLFETPPECVAVRIDDSEGQLGRLRYKLDQGTSGRDVQ